MWFKKMHSFLLLFSRPEGTSVNMVIQSRSSYASNFHMHISILLSLCPAKTTNRLTKIPPSSLAPPDRRRNHGLSRDPDRRAAHVPLRSSAQVKSLSRVGGDGGGGAKNDLLG